MVPVDRIGKGGRGGRDKREMKGKQNENENE
jgi:hypothetical protein